MWSWKKAAGIEPKNGKGIRKLLDEKLEQLRTLKVTTAMTRSPAADLKNW